MDVFTARKLQKMMCKNSTYKTVTRTRIDKRTGIVYYVIVHITKEKEFSIPELLAERIIEIKKLNGFAIFEISNADNTINYIEAIPID